MQVSQRMARASGAARVQRTRSVTVRAIKDGQALPEGKKLRVAVIGGGPSGACAAETLAKGGVEVTLIERKMDNCKVRSIGGCWVEGGGRGGGCSGMARIRARHGTARAASGERRRYCRCSPFAACCSCCGRLQLCCAICLQPAVLWHVRFGAAQHKCNEVKPVCMRACRRRRTLRRGGVCLVLLTPTHITIHNSPLPPPHTHKQPPNTKTNSRAAARSRSAWSRSLTCRSRSSTARSPR